MAYGAIAALLVGALFGIFLASRHFLRRKMPTWGAIAHGAAGATGFALLLVTVLSNPTFELAKRALLILVVAVFMGCVNVVFHIRGVRHRTVLVVGHALLAVSGVTTLAVAIATGIPSPSAGIASTEARRTEQTGIEPESRAIAAADGSREPRDEGSRMPSPVVPELPSDDSPALDGQVWSLHFDLARTRPDRDALATLDRIAASLRSGAVAGRIRVLGHADERGSTSTNAQITRARARSIVRALVRRGVPRSRLIPIGVGTECPNAPECAGASPPASCHGESAWRLDRRVTIEPVDEGAVDRSRLRACGPSPRGSP